MELRSPAFAAGGTIPVRYTCEGANISPPLEWSDLPEGTVTLLLTCDDPDAPRGTFRHWAAFNIPPDSPGLAAGASVAEEAVNDFGDRGYGGPCPPKGHGPHRYHFRLSALSGRIDAHSAADCAEIERLARGMEIARAELIGRFGR